MNLIFKQDHKLLRKLHLKKYLIAFKTQFFNMNKTFA